jgi:hypothetical protein
MLSGVPVTTTAGDLAKALENVFTERQGKMITLAGHSTRTPLAPNDIPDEEVSVVFKDPSVPLKTLIPPFAFWIVHLGLIAMGLLNFGLYACCFSYFIGVLLLVLIARVVGTASVTPQNDPNWPQAIQLLVLYFTTMSPYASLGDGA